MIVHLPVIIARIVINIYSIFSCFRGESVIRQRGQVTAVMWLDNRVIHVLSTNGQPSEITTVPRKQKDGSTKQITCPASILSYNTYMGGVDHGDQLHGYYHVRLKNRKYYKYIFWFLFDVSITNSYVLFKEAHPQCSFGKHVINYRIELARRLIGDYNSRKRIYGCTTTHSGHFPLKKVCEEGQETQRLRGKCYYCSINKIRRDTQWYCNECQHFFCHTGKVETDCFYIYHSNLSTTSS